MGNTAIIKVKVLKLGKIPFKFDRSGNQNSFQSKKIK